MGLIDSIIGAESGGNPNAQNPNSSASGPAQFIDSTWLATLKAHRPDIAQGQSDSDLLALKSDPTLSRQMTAAYADDNGKILASAGVPVTPGTTYLAHFSGPQGAVSVLKADPSAPVSSILGTNAVKANPFLNNMTAGDLRAWADRKMGSGSPQAVASPTSLLPPTLPPIFPQQDAKAVATQPAPQIAQASQPQIDAQVPAPAMPQLQQINLQSLMAQLPAPSSVAPPIIPPQRKSIDLSRLRAALQASGNRGSFFA